MIRNNIEAFLAKAREDLAAAHRWSLSVNIDGQEAAQHAIRVAEADIKRCTDALADMDHRRDNPTARFFRYAGRRYTLIRAFAFRWFVAVDEEGAERIFTLPELRDMGLTTKYLRDLPERREVRDLPATAPNGDALVRLHQQLPMKRSATTLREEGLATRLVRFRLASLVDGVYIPREPA